MRSTYKVLASTALVATVFASSALAADVDVAGPTTYSRQGVALPDGAGKVRLITLPNVTITLAAQYTNTDTMTVTLGGPALDSGSAPNMSCDNGILGSITVGFLGVTGNQALFRVTDVQNSTVGAVCTLSGLEAEGPAIAAVNSMSVDFKAQTAGGFALDTSCTTKPCNTAVIATVRDQFNAATNSGFDAVVDVDANRYAFVLPDTTDEFSFQQWTDALVNKSTPADANEATDFTEEATATSGKTVLSGDFSWLDGASGSTAAGCVLADYQKAVLTSAGTVTAGAADCTSVTITQGAAEDLDIVITLVPQSAAAKKVLAAQTFTAVVTLGWDTPASTTDLSKAFTLAAGEWTLNGFSAFVGYMPFGEGISTIVYASNSSSATGEVTIDGYDQAGNKCSFSAGMMPANSTMSLSGAINAGFANCYGTALNGKRVAFTVVINIPETKGDLYSAYNVNGVDRGTVVNSANGHR